MAVYNGGGLLKETIESVLAQTHCDFEFVIVDDGSSDGTVDVVEAFEDPRIRLLQPGRLASQSKCLNLGVEAAGGDWIARIDADDPAHPQRLEVLASACAQAEGYGILASDMQIVFDDAHPTWAPVPSAPPALVDLTQRLGYYNPVQHSAVLIRKSAFEQVGGFEPRLDLVNDYWLWGKIVHAGWKIGKVPVVLQAKRVHAGQNFENKRRLRFILETTKPQTWIGKDVLGWPSWKVHAIAVARIGYGLLPQRLRATMYKLRP